MNAKAAGIEPWYCFLVHLCKAAYLFGAAWTQLSIHFIDNAHVNFNQSSTLGAPVGRFRTSKIAFLSSNMPAGAFSYLKKCFSGQ